MLALLLLAAPYALPDGPPLRAPDDFEHARLERALLALRESGGDEVDRAVRDLALLGECALPAVVERLNAAPAGERLALLLAVRRVPRAAPLLVQAQADADPTVRAFFSVPRPPPEPSLRGLASRYLLALSLAEPTRRREADDACPELRAFPYFPPTLAPWMRDRWFSDAVQARRRLAATELARAGSAALRSGALEARPEDPLFAAYLALLREEGAPFRLAVEGLVGAGESVAPALEALVRREGAPHDPGVLARVLAAVRPDRARSLFDDETLPAAARRALVNAAVETLGVAEAVAVAERAAADPDADVRRAAQETLLALPAPAGRAGASRLLDPARDDLHAEDFNRAAALLARAGDPADLRALAEIVEVPVVQDGSRTAERLARRHQAARQGVRAWRGEGLEALAARWLDAPAHELRALGVELTTSREALARIAREDASLAIEALRRLVRLLGRGAGAEALAALERFPERRATILALLAEAGADRELAALARRGDARLRHDALAALASMDAIDPDLEAPLLELHAAAADGERDGALAALVPLGTEGARQRVVEAGAAALPVLVARARTRRIPFGVPLLRFVEGAGAALRADLCTVAQELPSAEPGFFAALYRAWEAERKDVDDTVESGAFEARRAVLDALARSDDVASADALFETVLAGTERRPVFLLGILEAATALLPPERLAALVPRVVAAAEAERARSDRSAPPDDDARIALLWGGTGALGWKRVDAAVEPFCAIVLDPLLHAAAYERGERDASAAPGWCLDALRNFAPARVDAAFRATLARMEREGALAAVHPRELLGIAYRAHGNRDRGRGLYEVALATLETLDRLPWDGVDAGLRARTLYLLGRYAEAAALARGDALALRARGLLPEEGDPSPAELEASAALYDAAAARSEEAFRAAIEGARGRPDVLNRAAWMAEFFGMPAPLQTAAAEESFRLTGGLVHAFRDTLAMARLREGRATEALALLDLRLVHPKQRPKETDGWHRLFLARAHLALGDRAQAAFALTHALKLDRRLLDTARSDPSLRTLPESFSEADADYFDSLFRWD